jgi:hypothetical protein
LVESQLHASGARYSTIHTAHFPGGTATSEGDDPERAGSFNESGEIEQSQGGVNHGRIERGEGKGDQFGALAD